MLRPFFFVHPEEEHGLRPIFVHEAFRDPLILRLLGYLDDLFVAEQERKRGAIAFREERWQRDDGADILVMLQGALERPHLLIGLVGVESAAICSGDNERQRIGAAAVIHILQTVTQWLVRLEIIE